MSSAPSLRRKDKEMPEARALDAIARGFVGRVATVGADGWPYCVPFLYVWLDGELLLHNSAVRGHFRTNIDHDQRVCSDWTPHTMSGESLTGRQTLDDHGGLRNFVRPR
jgi:nitroimidazol reductase NimA-like FMN-containing flavoprotein (pyridoxamine 5'-phosphate oxidase superfamily)